MNMRVRRRVWLRGLGLGILVAGTALTAGLYFNGNIAEFFYERERARLSGLAPSPGLPPGDVALVNVNVLPMTGEEVLIRQTVVVRQGRIASIGPAEEITPPAGIPAPDVAGAYVMPGIADMHVHSARNPLAFSLFLANGVTTIREMAGHPVYLEWAERVRSGKVLGPDVYTTGPILGARKEDAGERAIVNAEQARVEVEHEYAAGFRIIKPYTFLPADAYEAAMEEANQRDMLSVGHVPYSVGISGVAAAGQQELAHVHSLHQDFFVDFDPGNVFDLYVIDERRTAAIVSLMKAAGMRVCTTLIVDQALADSQDPDAYLGRPEQAFEPPEVTEYMRSRKWTFNRLWPHAYLEEVYLPWLYRLTGAMQVAGIPLVLGTDSGVPGIVHGFSAQRELQLLVKAGLSPYEALVTGTRHAAMAVGAEAEWGTIEVGKRANLLVVRDNPLQEIRNTEHILGVVKAGNWLDRPRLDRLLEEVQLAY